MNFGLVEALEKVLAPASRRLTEQLELIRDEQKETNRLLRDFLEEPEEPDTKAPLASVKPIKRTPRKP